MKASELIKELQKHVDAGDDFPIVHWTYSQGISDVGELSEVKSDRSSYYDSKGNARYNSKILFLA